MTRGNSGLVEVTNDAGQSIWGQAVRRGVNWTLADIARDGARDWPDAIAIVDDSQEISFNLLNLLVNRAANELLRLGIRPRDRVAVLGGRCATTVVALLAVATAGATYVALDASLPPERLRLLLEDADVSAAYGADEAIMQSIRAVTDRVLSTQDLLRLEAGVNATVDRRLATACPSDVAYILYTSGSTGMPKGVQIEHRSVRAFLHAHNERCKLGPGARCLNTGAIHFDVSVMDILLPLYSGATVYFAPPTPVPTLVLGMLERHRITCFYAVGTLLGLITGDGGRLASFDLSALELLLTGAEVCNVRVVNAWLNRYPHLKFVNSYGPTEATVGCISYEKTTSGPLPGESCPIGKPHSGTLVKLLGEDGQAIETAGVAGEILIAGHQLMRGYWRRPEEDARALIELDGVRFYRTGDHAYLDNDGNYWFVGRFDNEIKHHGYRIHLNEVCHGLSQDQRILSSAVGLIVSGSDREIAAAVVLGDAFNDSTVQDIRDCLSTRLPEYMIPTRWLVLDRMPVLSSGKTDLRGLMQTIENLARASRVAYFTGSNAPLSESIAS